MKPISWQRWAATFAILILLSFLADYFFLHLLFDPSHHIKLGPHQSSAADATDLSTASTPSVISGAEAEAATTAAANPTSSPVAERDNFLKTLQDCRSDVSAQGVATPQALMTYLAQSIGKKDEVVEIENFILRLPDGSERRIHMIPADNTNSKTKRELRYFKVDDEGYPERLTLTDEQKQMPVEELAQKLASEGQLEKHQVKSSITLRDGSFLSLETHNDKIYEFQWRPSTGEPTLSCRRLDCVCQ